MKIIGIPALIVGLALSAPVTADSMFRCTDSAIVHNGDSTSTVRLKCGSPEFKDYNVSGTLVESWTYRNPRADDRVTTLHFKHGNIYKIEDLGRIN